MTVPPCVTKNKKKNKRVEKYSWKITRIHKTEERLGLHNIAKTRDEHKNTLNQG